MDSSFKVVYAAKSIVSDIGRMVSGANGILNLHFKIILGKCLTRYELKPFNTFMGR